MRYESPLRYPGGKGRLAQYFKALLRANDLLEIEYVEPYAGGASVALSLLHSEYASRVHINDVSRPIYAFWHSVLHETEKLCTSISKARLDIREYRRQKAVMESEEPRDLLKLGFAAFYLNRTNRSGIIHSRAGPIGGNDQDGPWSLGARFNKPVLIERIQRVARQADRICLYNMDAGLMLRSVVRALPVRTLVYLDPPYYNKGQRLYANYYGPADHSALAQEVLRLRQRWVISYDDSPEVRRIYSGHTKRRYGVPYSAASRYSGAEVMIFSPDLVTPRIAEPARFTETAFRAWLRSSRVRAA